MSDSPITFVVAGLPAGTRGGAPGDLRRPAVGGLPGTVKASVRVGARRAAGDPVRVTAVPGEDVVVLHVANGPVLVLHPANARDLLLAQSHATRGGTAGSGGGSAVPPDVVAVPAQLQWTGLEQAVPVRTRGFLGDVLLHTFEVLTGLPKDGAAKFVAGRVVAAVDGRVDAGVYALSPDALAPLKGGSARLDAVPAADGPMLVLLHGTFVDTASTFGALWALHPGPVRALFAHYGDRVYALDHPTMGASPIDNALLLAQALPAHARLHLLSHSRGGLVAEVLARACADEDDTVFDAAVADGFAGRALAAQRAALLGLRALARSKGLRVERVVRVACPARGTLLASRRLDAYLSVLRWGLDLAGIPIAPALTDFAIEVARRREDPAQLPGLEAMLPDSALVRWLNRPRAALPGTLRVVAGDLEGDALGSWVKTLLADAFFWTDNDLVVQTRSMYGGAPRRDSATFLLDQGGKVSHFAYFSQARTAEAVVGALLHDDAPGFRPIGRLSWAGLDAGGLRAAAAPTQTGSAPHDRPAVLVLPGLFGSQLARGGERVWMGPALLGDVTQLAWRGPQADRLRPDGLVGPVYDALVAHLAATHEAIPFAYDWRRPFEDEAHRLADAVTAALDVRAGNGQPVRLLAHGAGGLLARALQLERPEVWQRLMAHEGASVLMLGAPNGGSWAPMQSLSGDDRLAAALEAFGAPLQQAAARQMLAEMPGLLQQQAALDDPAQGLAQEATWRRLAADDLRAVRGAAWWHRGPGGDASGDGATPAASGALATCAWGVPPQPVLEQALAFRRRLDAQRDRALPEWAGRMRIVLGQSSHTADGWEWSDGGLVYRDVLDAGDGRVTTASALLPGVRAWTLDVTNGQLADAHEAFDAYVDLLERGDTSRLLRLEPAGRGPARTPASDPVHVRSRPSRGQPSAPAPPESLRALLAAGPPPRVAPASATPGTALRVTLLNGDLKFVAHPLILGHYRAIRLTGTEGVVDRMLGGVMSASLDAGLYPDGVGTHQVFANTMRDPDNPWRAPHPEAVVVVGLGAEGDLNAAALSRSVRQGVLAWSQRQSERPDGTPGVIELAATLIGSGGLGISPGASAVAIAQGVREANVRLAANGWPVVTELWLVELFLERAAEAWRSLQVQATATPGRYEIAPAIVSGTGPLRRQLDSAYRGTDYDLITAETQADDHGDQSGRIAFRLDTRRARTEVRAQMTQARLVRTLVTQAANDANTDPQLGRTLFQLLVPPEVEPFLGGTDQMLLELDAGTAGIPWELLDTPIEDRAGGDRRPWAIRSKLLRKLRSEDYRAHVQDADVEDHVLVIGEPKIDDPRYAPLPGALAEATEVAATFTADGGVGAERVTALLGGADASTILNALLARRYRIVHIAGHGEPGALGGLVMSDHTVLGPREIQSMRTVPELVFVNCCHLAARDARQLLAPLDRAQFAADVADALIRIGVRCVVAAGWAVEDEPARLFATTLYQALLGGRSFIEAVAHAREEAWMHADGGNTWAAYQCYGDPNWTFRRAASDAPPERSTLSAEFAGIASPMGLALALEELTVRSRYQDAAPELQRQKLLHLEARFGALWAGMGALSEAYAVAYAEAGDLDAAIDHYGRAVRCNDGSATMRAAEQLAHLTVRRAWTRSRGGDAGARQAARSEIEAALARLDALAALEPTSERHSLRGSAWKRLAMLARDDADPARAEAALTHLVECYRAALDAAAAVGDVDETFPTMNLLSASVAAAGPSARPWRLDADLLALVRRQLEIRQATTPDFWSMVGAIELEMLEALAGRRLAAAAPVLREAFADLKRRVQAPRMWGSVADNADFLLTPWLTVRRRADAQAAQGLLEALRSHAAV